jgi:hypothetical protein
MLLNQNIEQVKQMSTAVVVAVSQGVETSVHGRVARRHRPDGLGRRGTSHSRLA